MKQSSFVWFGLIFNLREGGRGVEYNENPGDQINPKRFMTTYYNMDTKDFLQIISTAHAEWTKKFGDLPIPLRQKVYFEQQARN